MNEKLVTSLSPPDEAEMDRRAIQMLHDAGYDAAEYPKAMAKLEAEPVLDGAHPPSDGARRWWRRWRSELHPSKKPAKKPTLSPK